MTDLTDRLRESWKYDQPDHFKFMDEAADEIERLREGIKILAYIESTKRRLKYRDELLGEKT